MNNKEKLEKIREKALLTPEEKETAKAKAIKQYHKQTPSFQQNDGDRFQVILDFTVEAQLDKALNTEGIWIESADQSLPEEPKACGMREQFEDILSGFRTGQMSVLRQDRPITFKANEVKE